MCRHCLLAVTAEHKYGVMSSATPSHNGVEVPEPRQETHGLVNAVMLITWPQRRDMIQHAVLAFALQDHPQKTLTVVNDGAPCKLSAAFFGGASLSGRVVPAPPGASIGEKRNIATRVVPDAEFIASFDDDDFSLPNRLSVHVAKMRASNGVWLSASRKFIALHNLENIVGFEHGRCYGAGMMRAEVARLLPWPHVSYREDQQLFEQCRAHTAFGSNCMLEADDLTYVHRRHESNASASHRQSLWQGVVPTQLGGADAIAAEALARQLVSSMAPNVEYLIDGEESTPFDIVDGDTSAPVAPQAQTPSVEAPPPATHACSNPQAGEPEHGEQVSAASEGPAAAALRLVMASMLRAGS